MVAIIVDGYVVNVILVIRYDGDDFRTFFRDVFSGQPSMLPTLSRSRTFSEIFEKRRVK